MWRSGDEGTHLAGASQQHRGLEAYHLEVFLGAHVVAVLEVHVPLLALVDFHGGAVEEFHHLLGALAGRLRDVLCGHGEHGVAAQDGHVVVPSAVHGGLSATHVGAVHHVVVQQGEVVKQLQPHCGLDGSLHVAAQGFAGHEHQLRTQSLAAQRHGVGDGLIELLGLCRIGDGRDSSVYSVKVCHEAIVLLFCAIGSDKFLPLLGVVD